MNSTSLRESKGSTVQIREQNDIPRYTLQGRKLEPAYACEIGRHVEVPETFVPETRAGVTSYLYSEISYVQQTSHFESGEIKYIKSKPFRIAS